MAEVTRSARNVDRAFDLVLSLAGPSPRGGARLGSGVRRDPRASGGLAFGGPQAVAT